MSELTGYVWTVLGMRRAEEFGEEGAARYVDESALISLRSQVEALTKERSVYLGIAGAAFGGTDPVRKIAEGCKSEYDASQKAYLIYRADWDKSIDAFVAPLKERAQAAEARAEALQKALCKLTMMARTSGGTPGPDAELMAACEQAESLIDAALDETAKPSK